jgi:hypothetical protein
LNINNRHPPLWILIYGFVIITFGIFLLMIGSGIRVFLIFLVIGLSLIGLWLYLDIRKEGKQKKREVYLNTIQACICAICKHKETNICLQQKCACCLIMKGDVIIGHHTNKDGF